MVNPLYLFAASLAVAFLLPLIDKLGRKVSLVFVYAVIAAWGGYAAYNIIALVAGSPAVEFGTAGFVAPLAIVLRIGLMESLGIAAISAVGLLAASFMGREMEKAPIGGSMSLLMVLMGLCGIVVTRDLFNLFVFLEISSIATYGLIGFDDRKPAMRGAFKYMIAGGIASSLYLIGAIYIYRFGDQLNHDLAIAAPGLGGTAGTIAIFFLLASLLVELKPFPANGWAIDVYETANPGVSAILSGASATALALALFKIMPLLGEAHLALVAGSGLATFVAANLAGARQRGTRRMLGYSSTAQIGLITATMALGKMLGFGEDTIFAVAAGLLANHLLAKTGLFLLAGSLADDQARNRSGAALAPLPLTAAGILVLALVGLPPFPGFWAKWELVGSLISTGQWWIIALILGGSLVEAFYMLRWFGSLAKGGLGESGESAATLKVSILPSILAALALLGLGIFVGVGRFGIESLLWAPLAAAALFFLIDKAPGWVKGLMSILVMCAFGFLAIPRLDGLKLFFAIMLLGGGILYTFASLYKTGTRRGLHPLLLASTLAMVGVLLASSAIELFFSWELMTIMSWLLVLRGKKGETAALRYILFGLGGAFLIMTGLLASGGNLALRAPGFDFGSTGNLPWAAYLMLAGLLVKAGAFGVHVWLPEAYAESNDEVSGFLSASLSKVSVFLIIAVLIALGGSASGTLVPYRLLGWIGLATALFGALYAVYQEDIKKTLAWSSMSQIGYIILALAVMNEAGWTTALYLALNHFIYKSMLFLAVAGVIYRVKTRNMYEMGGLIKKMPLSFLSVLMAIIALAGIPPLSGFGGKWLLYSTLIQKGWYLEAGVAFFSSAVAFLYLFRLIHAISLGQPKPSQAKVKEAPVVLLIPQLMLMAALFAVSAFPHLMLDPIMSITSSFFAPIFAFSGSTLSSPLGYWDGTLSMIVTVAVFLLCLGWMLFNLHNPQAVKQFNIVYAAERPFKPETTHYAWNFYAPYEKALGFLTKGRGERFWATFATGVDAVGGAIRRLYTGNGQTYALHIILYVSILYLFLGVR
ncbi:MAG: proton-conducting transporter membrane subunit [Spirochaetales bacterium]|jgi:formate hydrogenlyase subunit 3/multisubunit Na+/H+ antiporter MnhD subunit